MNFDRRSQIVALILAIVVLGIVWVTGPGLGVRGRTVPEGVPAVPEGLRDPRPESLLRVGLARFLAGERDDLWTAEPLYLRPSSAEEQWQRKAP